MLAVGDRLHHQVFGDPVATDQLDHDVDIRIGDDQVGVVDHDALAIRQLSGALYIEVGDHRNLDAAASAAHDLFLIAPKHVECAGADGADS